MKLKDYFITLSANGDGIELRAYAEPHLDDIYINRNGLATIFYVDQYLNSAYVQATTDGFKHISIQVKD